MLLSHDKKFLWLAFLLSLLLFSCIYQKKDMDITIDSHKSHHTKNGFQNPEGSFTKEGFSLQHLWFFITRPFSNINSKKPAPEYVLDKSEAKALFNKYQNFDSITWIGHMTSLVKLSNKRVLIDPWLTDYCTFLPPFGPKRVVPPSLGENELGNIDLIIISHNHYDHLDIPTLKKLENENTTLVVPLKLSRYLKDLNYKSIIELDWYDDFVYDGIKVTALPIVHWSKRTLFDTNETLWASFLIEDVTTHKKIWFGEGDYGSIYKDIGNKYGPIDYALIASGAYEPYKVMKGAHCLPESCLRIVEDLNASHMIPLHWGTVSLGEEDIDAPPKALIKLKKNINNNPTLKVIKIGQTLKI